MKYIAMILTLLLCAVFSLTACSDRRQPPPEPQAVQEEPSLPQEEAQVFESGVSRPKDKEETGEEESSTEVKETFTGREDFLLLVNKEHPLPEDFDIQLATVQGEYRVDARILEPAQRMIADAKADGIDLLVCSAYRPVDSQTRLFNNKVSEYVSAGKTQEEAAVLTAAIIAVPGTSEHHTGLAMDIVTPSYQNLDEGFAQTAAFAWLDENAASYGFILRYPADKQEETGIIYESWHYRYVGPEIAKEIKEKGICLEEYLGDIP